MKKTEPAGGIKFVLVLLLCMFVFSLKDCSYKPNKLTQEEQEVFYLVNY